MDLKKTLQFPRIQAIVKIIESDLNSKNKLLLESYTTSVLTMLNIIQVRLQILKTSTFPDYKPSLNKINLSALFDQKKNLNCLLPKTISILFPVIGTLIIISKSTFYIKIFQISNFFCKKKYFVQTFNLSNSSLKIEFKRLS
jgi:hypothetical protein